MSPLGIIFILTVCAAMPVLAIRSARQLERQEDKPTIPDLLVSTLIVQGLVLTLAIFTARAHSISLFPSPSFAPLDAAAALVFLTLALLANILRWRVMTEADRAQLSWLRPQAARDLLAWAGIALVAGIAEEIIYRGVLFALFHQLVGNDWAAIAICVIAFALGHFVQGRGAMLVIIFFAAAFHVLVRITGDLYTAIAVHVTYDFVAGIVLWALARNENPTRVPLPRCPQRGSAPGPSEPPANPSDIPSS